LNRNDLQTIEQHLRRVADALERISPPPPKSTAPRPSAPISLGRDTSEPDIGTTGF